ncbi:MAG TPA: hypothetical protein P5119_06415 [Candidatus Aminicenantes bacterium]|nr:hypothetical protein [Candidatus Aminicenantes bacterium]HRY64960.1 hypothetical protein [Candidatus Aminicenantes bacterium]HRZ71873.1 hypothetical protein [Candidatus Aminicenantes bacterium]
MSDTPETKRQEAAAAPEAGPGMSQGHVLDLKLPIGWLLSAYGVLLAVYGLLTKKEMYEISLGINLNLIWGVLMLVLGGAFLLAAFVKKDRKKRA